MFQMQPVPRLNISTELHQTIKIDVPLPIGDCLSIITPSYTLPVAQISFLIIGKLGQTVISPCEASYSNLLTDYIIRHHTNLFHIVNIEKTQVCLLGQHTEKDHSRIHTENQLKVHTERNSKVFLIEKFKDSD